MTKYVLNLKYRQKIPFNSSNLELKTNRLGPWIALKLRMQILLRIRFLKAFVALLLATTLSVASFASLSPAASKYCQAMLAKAGLPRSVHVHEYGENRCYYNVYNLIVHLKDDPNFDLEKMKVLYISHLDGFEVHAILAYENFIIDPTQPSDAANEAQLIPREEYFVHVPAMFISEIRVIPAKDYLNEFQEKTPAFYIEGMDVDTRNIPRARYSRSANQRYPLMLLTDYFQQEHVEPVFN